MARHDAERVGELLEQAKRAATPLKDPGLEKKIGDAQKHVQEKLDPQKGG